MERLPAFLQSECYLEYRLAKLISHAQVAHNSNDYVSIKIDYHPLAKKNKKNEKEEEPEVDETEVRRLMLSWDYKENRNALLLLQHF